MEEGRKGEGWGVGGKPYSRVRGEQNRKYAFFGDRRGGGRKKE